MKYYLHIVLLASFLITGCSENPLLGVWKVKAGQKGAFVMCKEITFKKDYSKCAGMVENVSYDVKGTTVIVSSELGDKLGIKAAYEIVDKNTMVLELPLGGKITYGRSSY